MEHPPDKSGSSEKGMLLSALWGSVLHDLVATILFTIFFWSKNLNIFIFLFSVFYVDIFILHDYFFFILSFGNSFPLSG